MSYHINLTPTSGSAYADFKAMMSAVNNGAALSSLVAFYWQDGAGQDWSIAGGLSGGSGIIFCSPYGAETFPSVVADFGTTVQLDNKPGQDWTSNRIKIRPISGSAYNDFKKIAGPSNPPSTKAFKWAGSASWEVGLLNWGVGGTGAPPGIVTCSANGAETFPSSFATDYPSAVSLTNQPTDWLSVP